MHFCECVLMNEPILYFIIHFILFLPLLEIATLSTWRDGFLSLILMIFNCLFHFQAPFETVRLLPMIGSVPCRHGV